MSHVSFPGLGIEFTINDVAFTIGGLEVYWYGILIALSLMIGIMYATSHAKTFGLDEDKMMDVILIAAISAVVCGRLFYVAFESEFHVSNLKEFFNLRGGGMAFYGVLLGAIISVLIVCKINGVKATCLLDSASMGFMLGQGIGRWGNFFNQELFGTNTDLPWGMYSDTIARYISRNADRLHEAHGIVLYDGPVHPTFLYESIWCILGAVMLSTQVKKRRFDGEIFLKYLIWNGIGRAFTETLRTDALFVGRIRISRLVCIILAVVSAIILISVKSKIRRLGDDEYLKPFAQTEAYEQYIADLTAKREAKVSSKAVADTADDNEESAESAEKSDSLETDIASEAPSEEAADEAAKEEDADSDETAE